MSALCKSIGSAQVRSIIVPNRIAFIGRISSVFSVCSRGVACPYTHWLTLAAGSFWKSAKVTGTMTGAKLRLTTQSQTYRATCWTAAKWLCFSLWGNSLLSLMLTVVVGYWGLARLLGLGGKKGVWLQMGWGRGLTQNVLRLGDESPVRCLHSRWFPMTVYYTVHVCCDFICVPMWVTHQSPVFALVLHDRKQEGVYCSWPAVFVPAVLVNSFSILTQTGQQQNRTKMWDVVQHLESSCFSRGCGILWLLSDDSHPFAEEGCGRIKHFMFILASTT